MWFSIMKAGLSCHRISIEFQELLSCFESHHICSVPILSGLPSGHWDHSDAFGLRRWRRYLKRRHFGVIALRIKSIADLILVPSREKNLNSVFYNERQACSSILTDEPSSRPKLIRKVRRPAVGSRVPQALAIRFQCSRIVANLP